MKLSKSVQSVFVMLIMLVNMVPQIVFAQPMESTELFRDSSVTSTEPSSVYDHVISDELVTESISESISSSESTNESSKESEIVETMTSFEEETTVVEENNTEFSIQNKTNTLTTDTTNSESGIVMQVEDNIFTFETYMINR